MADNVLRIGTEFDVGPIISGAQRAGAAVEKLGNDVAAQAQRMQAQGFTAEETAAALHGLGYSSEEVSAAMGAEAASTEKATVALADHGREAIQTRLATDLMTGQISRSEQALVRFASHIPAIGVLMEAAFPVFAVAVFADLLGRVYEGMKKVSDALTGYTESLKKAEEADAKWSEAAFSHVATLEGGFERLSDIIREQADLASESYGAKFSAAIDQAGRQTSILYDALGPLGSAIKELSNLYEGLAGAETNAANQAVRLEAAQRTVMAGILDQQIATDREASKLVADRLAAQNAWLTGSRARIDALKNEQSALADQQANAEKAATAEAAKEAITKGPGNQGAVVLEQQARAKVDEEYYYKRQELAGRLAAAEQDYQREEITHNDRVIRQFAEMNAAAEKSALAMRSLAFQESQLFDMPGETQKEMQAAVVDAQKLANERVKYAQDTARMAEQAALQRIATEEKTATEISQIDSTHRLAGTLTEMGRVRVAQEVSDQLIAEERKTAAERLKVELDFLEESKRIMLGGVTEQSYVVNASPDQLGKLEAVNRQIETAQQAHAARMEELDRQSQAAMQKTADAQVAAYTKAFQPINRAMDGMVNGILQGTLTIQQAFVRMGANIALTTIDALAQIALKWAEHEAAITIAHLVGTQTRVAATATAAGETRAINAVSGIHEVTHAAAVAAANAYKAMAGIPVIGPVLGAAAAAATFGAVMAFEALAGAEAGAEIPANMPLMVHAGETVAPKPLSAEMHALVPNIQKFNMTMQTASPGAARAPSHTMNSTSNFHISALDSQSFSDFAQRNQGRLAGIARRMVRNGVR